MRIAIIDLGTNSVRFDVHQLGPKKAVKTLHREKVMVRLGQGLFTKGQLDHDAIHRVTHAFSAFKRISDELSVSKVIALGTSALREAVDGAKLVKQIQRATGIDVRVISGTEEARLIAVGVLGNERIPRHQVALVDIGGGSTEISIARGRKVSYCESFPLGTARLQQVFLRKSPPSAGDIEELRFYVRKSLLAKTEKRRATRASEIIGSSGTVKAIARIVRKSSGKKHVTRDELRALVKKMSRMNTTQLLGLPGMEAKRVDMILAGALLLEECLDMTGADRVTPTEYALRDGILKEQLELARKHMGSRISLHLPELVERAKRLGGDEKSLRGSLECAKELFQKLRPLHKLDRDWRIYLEAAVALRDAGEAVSLVGHPEHSCYIVRNAKFAFIEEWESELVAQLCRFHEHHKLDAKGLPFGREKKLQKAFLRLLAVLCVVDALDAVQGAPVALKRVKLARGSVTITYAKGSSSDLEVFRAESRRAVFESVFRRKLSVRRT